MYRHFDLSLNMGVQSNTTHCLRDFVKIFFAIKFQLQFLMGENGLVALWTALSVDLDCY